ncbi:MAG: MarR family transcriptional regulator [Candidatus Zixiibacteriota bacterium]|nr:MAG: MarR family transcriptional regulator [candidate division Zixibacteria bacterium]
MATKPDYIDQLGTLALVSRLRRLLNRMLAEGEKVYKSLDIDFVVSWFPIFHLLAYRSPLMLTDIAKALGMAHPSVIEVTDEMIRRGFIKSRKSEDDRRCRHLSLTPKGKKTISKLEPVWEAFRQAGEEINKESGNNFLEAIKKLELAMERRSMYERITIRLKKK